MVVTPYSTTTLQISNRRVGCLNKRDNERNSLRNGLVIVSNLIGEREGIPYLVVFQTIIAAEYRAVNDLRDK